MAKRSWYLIQRAAWEDESIYWQAGMRLTPSSAWQCETLYWTDESLPERTWERKVPVALYPDRAAAEAEAARLTAAALSELDDLIDPKDLYDVIELILED